MTSKQIELLEACNKVLKANKVKVYINTAPSEFGDPISCDIEHDEHGNLVCIGIYDGRDARVYTKIDVPLTIRLKAAKLIMHNGVSDIEALRSWGIDIKNDQLIWDTMLISHIIDSSKKGYSLEDIEKREFGLIRPHYDEIVGKHKGKTKKHPACPKLQSDCCGRLTLDKQPVELTAKYNALDVWVPYQIAKRQGAPLQ